MEETGIYYYFNHSANKHKLILEDGGFFSRCYAPSIPLMHQASNQAHFDGWEHHLAVSSDAASSLAYQYEQPTKPIQAQHKQSSSSSKYLLFQYTHTQTSTPMMEQSLMLKLRQEQLQANFIKTSGDVHC